MALVASDARSEASGAGSARSSGSRKYKVVSRGSNVDESLFGSSNHKGRKNGSGRKVLIGEVSRLCCSAIRCVIESLVDGVGVSRGDMDGIVYVAIYSRGAGES